MKRADPPWVISGVGLVSAAGDCTDSLASAIALGRPATAAPPQVGLVRVAIPDFDPRRYLERKGLRSLSRVSQLACAAAARAAPAVAGVPPERVGVVLGTAWASLDSIVAFERRALLDGPRFVDPLLFTETVANVPAGHVSIIFGWSALNATVASESVAGLEALRVAIDMLEDDRAAVVVAGGADELNVRLLDVLGEDAQESGAARFGEGACWLVVESRDHARERGAPVLARLAGVATCWVDSRPLAPELAALVRELLEDVGAEPGSVDVIVSHDGPGSSAAREAVGQMQEKGRAPVLDPATALGETWAASGPFGVALALEALGAAVDGPLPPARRALVLGASAHGHAGAALLERVEDSVEA